MGIVRLLQKPETEWHDYKTYYGQNELDDFVHSDVALCCDAEHGRHLWSVAQQKSPSMLTSTSVTIRFEFSRFSTTVLF